MQVTRESINSPINSYSIRRSGNRFIILPYLYVITKHAGDIHNDELSRKKAEEKLED